MKRRSFLASLAALIPATKLLLKEPPAQEIVSPVPIQSGFVTLADVTPPLPIPGHTFTTNGNGSVTWTISIH